MEGLVFFFFEVPLPVFRQLTNLEKSTCETSRHKPPGP